MDDTYAVVIGEALVDPGRFARVGVVHQQVLELVGDDTLVQVGSGRVVADAVLGLRDHVASLRLGLAADVGEDGLRMSAGQRARLVLARAVLAQRPLTLVDEPSALGALSFAQVCGLWRKSASALAGAPTPAARADVVAVRARLLAELERREPAAMAAWIAAGDCEPDGPSAYLLGAASVSSRER